METDLQKILKLKLPCFSCEYGHNCKYYSNSLWVEWMCSNPEVCPASLYSFESLYFVLLEEKKRKKKEAEAGKIRFIV